jgi:hypothetical protein
MRRVAIASVLVLAACADVPARPVSPQPTAAPAKPTLPDAFHQLQLAEQTYTRAKQTKAIDDDDAAATQFEAVVARGELPEGLLVEAAFAAALSRRAAWEADPASQQVTSDDDDLRNTAPLELPASARRMLDAFHAVERRAPDDEMAISMEFIEGQLDYRYHRVDDALHVLRDIVDHHRKHETAPEAVPLVLDLLVRAHRDRELRAFVATLRENRDWLDAHPELAALVAKLPKS